ncbi:MAG: DUF5615 family PIN-like protein [Pseudomonadota bacterium]|jgi:predicted nuclease of predicted toxin-antitoxin system
MIFWVDAQLPPALAGWLGEKFGVEAASLKSLGLRDARDEEIFLAARAANAVILSKDSDFVDLIARLGPPPRLIWVTCGNVTNRHLQALFKHTFPDALALLDRGEQIVEIGDLDG